MKGLAQWRTRLTNTGGVDDATRGQADTMDAVGRLIYRHVQDDGTWSAAPLQGGPAGL